MKDIKKGLNVTEFYDVWTNPETNKGWSSTHLMEAYAKYYAQSQLREVSKLAREIVNESYQLIETNDVKHRNKIHSLQVQLTHLTQKGEQKP